MVAKYLAVNQETGDLWLEDNESALNASLIMGNPVDFYSIELDENNKPVLGLPSGIIPNE